MVTTSALSINFVHCMFKTFKHAACDFLYRPVVVLQLQVLIDYKEHLNSIHRRLNALPTVPSSFVILSIDGNQISTSCCHLSMECLS
jgi:hypothetical protein